MIEIYFNKLVNRSNKIKQFINSMFSFDFILCFKKMINKRFKLSLSLKKLEGVSAFCIPCFKRPARPLGQFTPSCPPLGGSVHIPCFYLAGVCLYMLTSSNSEL